MPVSPAGGQAYAKAIADLYGDAAAHLIAVVSARLSRGITEPGWAERKLSEILGLRADALNVLGVLADFGPEAVQEAIAAAYESGAVAAGGPGAQATNEGLVATNQGAVKAYATELASTVQATHTRILRTTEDVYRRVIAETAGQVAGGAQTTREAAAKAVARFAQQGVAGFTDARGRNWTLESYAEMATRTAAGQAHIQGGLDRFAQQGRYLVVVSDAPEECKLCRPFEGAVLSLTGRIPTDGELGAHSYGGTLAHARGQGFMHPNCRHALSAFIPGLTKPLGRPTADPDGDRLRQQQRALERAVRESKRRLAAVQPLGDTQQLVKERALLRARQDRLVMFVDEHDRKRLRYREAGPTATAKPVLTQAPKPEKTQLVMHNIAKPAEPKPPVKKQLTLHNIAKPAPSAAPAPAVKKPLTFADLVAAKKKQQAAAHISPTPTVKPVVKPAATASPRPAPAARPAGGGRLRGDQYAQLQPTPKWSAERREQIAADLRKTKPGARFVEAVDRFQEGGKNIPRLRNAIAKRAAGEDVAGAWGERADAWIDAIRNAPAERAPEKLYRGMVLPGDVQKVLAKYKAGDPLPLSLSSFTSDRKVAVKFQEYSQRPGTSTKVMFEMVGDEKKAVPIQNLTAPERSNYFNEKEWVSMGSFRIKEVKLSPSGGIIVRIVQEGVL